MISPIRIATRQSTLALRQAEMIREAILALQDKPRSPQDVVLVPFQTTGDRNKELSLLEIGGKGLFTKEIEEAVLNGKADIAMHSLKDMTVDMPPGLRLAGCLPRADYRDVMVTSKGWRSIKDIPLYASIGTSSPRRAAQLLALRPDIRIVPFRGNVPTRLQKVEHGNVDGCLLAAAGLERLGLENHIAFTFDENDMLPAIGQGIIAMQCRTDDLSCMELIRNITCHQTWAQLTAERALLENIGGDCHTPLAGLARYQQNKLAVKGLVISQDGKQVKSEVKIGPIEQAAEMGAEIGRVLKQAAVSIWS